MGQGTGYANMKTCYQFLYSSEKVTDVCTLLQLQLRLWFEEEAEAEKSFELAGLLASSRFSEIFSHKDT